MYLLRKKTYSYIPTLHIGGGINTKTNGTEQRTPKETHKYTQVIFFFRKDAKANSMQDGKSFQQMVEKKNFNKLLKQLDIHKQNNK